MQQQQQVRRERGEGGESPLRGTRFLPPYQCSLQFTHLHVSPGTYQEPVSSPHTFPTLPPAPPCSLGTSLQFSPGTYQAGFRVMIYAPLPQSLWTFLQVSPPSPTHCSHFCIM